MCVVDVRKGLSTPSVGIDTGDGKGAESIGRADAPSTRRRRAHALRDRSKSSVRTCGIPQFLTCGVPFRNSAFPQLLSQKDMVSGQGGTPPISVKSPHAEPHLENRRSAFIYMQLRGFPAARALRHPRAKHLWRRPPIY
jgi:hypothetical protein